MNLDLNIRKTVLSVPVFLLLLLSCKDTAKSIEDVEIAGNTWDIKLENNLGVFSITLPRHLDTLFTWTQYSDCGDGCAKIDYRIQSKFLPVFKDNGFFWIPLKDSVEQFTIKHSKLMGLWKTNDTSLVRVLSKRLKEGAFENRSNNFLVDTIMKIKDQNIAAIGFINIDTLNNTKLQVLNAITLIDGNLIELFFEYRKSYVDTISTDFMKTSFDALKTIRVIRDDKKS